MDKSVQVKIVRSDNKIFTIGNDMEWRFRGKGLDSFGEFSNDINYVDNGLGDGGYIASSRMSEADRTLECAYMIPSLNDVARKTASAFFNPKLSYKVYITYAGRTRWAEGQIKKFQLGMDSNIEHLMKLMVTFTFPNPYWKSYDNFGKNIASVAGRVGFPYLASTSTGYTAGVFNFAKKVDISNDGDIDTFCTAVFTASNDVVNPKLILNDSYVRVIDEMEEGDVIEMDFTAMPPTVKKNGVNFIGHCDRTSSFTSMHIATGDSVVQFDADDGSDHLDVYIYYNQLYASI